jgi:hypothetical protein
MEPNLHTSLISRPRLVLLAVLLCLSVTSLLADTYRWKDKDGKPHYGSAVPAEYANQPYDVLNNAGIVIDRVEDTTVPMDVREEIKNEERKPLISLEERLRQYDRLLVIQYRSEGEITQALDFELAQLGYDKRIIEQSRDSTATAIRDQIRQAADQQRAGQTIGADRHKTIEKLYARQRVDQQKHLAMSNREAKIRSRFKKDLERYLFLTLKNRAGNEIQTDQG